MKNRPSTFRILVASLLFGASVQAAAQQELHVYNWSDYIAEDTIERFQQESGIKVLYDVYDSNEVLEAKLLAGHSGYDLVFPTARPFADRQIKAGIFQPLDKARLGNHANLDPVILESLADIDTGNAHLAPYMWGTTGLGINLTKVREILGANATLDSWSLVFDPSVTAKLASCGISLMDDPTEVLVAARAYIGQAPNDYGSAALDEAATVLAAVRPNIRYYHSSQYINDLANGDLCVAHGYSGDVLQARARAEEAGNGVEIAYLVPREGAVVWTDVMAIPADAPNGEAAHRFIDFLLRPDVIAPISNYVAYANANAAATELVDDAVRQDPGIYPPQATRERFITLKTPSNRETKAINRLWTRIKTGH
ncbi:polyamine ABC transporter substrate-binding protein [Marinobacterium rhizophilum]|uniref:Putrescine-binding periplasmic protein n=1 Tax=Marinobacterium rhizophilum TaxID=420402 RepID=A0ABY5HN79_9GAMM|nr:polyamine ABC transporter substrate-binding protein [Marinobacterium rhizophilum]UTW13891.1 polyamine ABC transporter substrate-binding protein [Marinobacterium rhizophilum]